MPFTKASFPIHSLFEKYINVPYLLDMNQNCISRNPKFSNKWSAIWFKILAYMLYQPGMHSQLLYLFYNTSIQNAEQIYVEIPFYLIFTCLITLTNASNHLIITCHFPLQNFVSECCRFVYSFCSCIGHLRRNVC